MNPNFELLILSALTQENHSISSLMLRLDIDNSYLQEFSTIISKLAHLEYISYHENKLCITTKGNSQQKKLYEQWKQTNNLLFNILKGTNNE